MYRVWCRFEPEYVNPLTGRVGRWRVDSVLPNVNCLLVGSWMPGGRLEGLYLTSTKAYKRGSIIRPHKELNRVLAARKAAQ